MTPIDIQVSRSKISVEGQAYYLYVGEGGYWCFTNIYILSVVNFNICLTFDSERWKLYICHAYSTNEALPNDTKVNDLVTFTVTFMLKIPFLDFELLLAE